MQGGEELIRKFTDDTVVHTAADINDIVYDYAPRVLRVSNATGDTAHWSSISRTWRGTGNHPGLRDNDETLWVIDKVVW